MTTFFPPKSKWQGSLPALCAASRHAAAVALCVCLAGENSQNSRSIGLTPMSDEVFTKRRVQCSWILLRTSFKFHFFLSPQNITVWNLMWICITFFHGSTGRNGNPSPVRGLFSPYFNCPGGEHPSLSSDPDGLWGKGSVARVMPFPVLAGNCGLAISSHIPTWNC